MRVLLFEDESRIADVVDQGLREQGYAVDVASTGDEALAWTEAAEFDLIILDVMLPVRDGIEVCLTLRQRGVRTPVLMLTAKDTVEDRVRGLDSGAEDYLVKPFAFSELRARVDALLRRRAGPAAEATVLKVADVEMDLLARRLTRAGRVIELQPREFKLLEVLLRNAGRVVTRTMLLEQVWDYHFDPQTNVIDVHVSRLRRKVDQGFDTPLIETARGVGYVIREPR